MTEPLKNRLKQGTIGDVNPISYSGGFVFAILEDDKTTGREIHWIEPPSEDECPAHLFETDQEPDTLRWTVYRVPIDDDCLAQCDWADINAIAASCGETALRLRQKAVSAGLWDRAHFLEDVAGHYGWTEFDSEPLRFSRSEIETYYQEWL